VWEWYTFSHFQFLTLSRSSKLWCSKALMPTSLTYMHMEGKGQPIHKGTWCLCTCVLVLYSVYHLVWYLSWRNDMASVHTRQVFNFTCIRLHRTTVKPSNTLVAGLISGCCYLSGGFPPNVIVSHNTLHWMLIFTCQIAMYQSFCHDVRLSIYFNIFGLSPNHWISPLCSK